MKNVIYFMLNQYSSIFFSTNDELLIPFAKRHQAGHLHQHQQSLHKHKYLSLIVRRSNTTSGGWCRWCL